MNQIYWVNASLKSVSPINGMAHSLPVSDFDAFDTGEPAPAALPSPPSIPIPVPQPRTSQTQPKKGRLLLHLAARSRWRPKRKNRNRNRRMMVERMKVQVAKRKSLSKNKELVYIYEPCNKTLYTEYRCYGVDITDPRYNIKRGAPTVFVPQQNECHCGKMCDDQADLAQHETNDHPANSVWNCNFCAHNSTKRDYIWKHVRTQHHNKHVHICQFKSCKQGTNGRRYGNDKITSVWAHMIACATLWDVSCVKIFSVTRQSKESIMLLVKNCPSLGDRRNSFAQKKVVVKKYVDQEALDRHVGDHEGRIIHPVCQYCGKQLSTQSALNLHIDTACLEKPEPPEDEV